MMRTGKKQGGVAIIEFALVAFIFFLIMWGILEFGRAFYVVNSMQHLTRCVAREAAVRLPSQVAGGQAEVACLLNRRWPLISLNPDDFVTDPSQRLFIIEWVTKDGTRLGRNEVTGGGNKYDPVAGNTTDTNPLSACPSSDKCIVEVQVSVKDRAFKDFGLLRAFGVTGQFGLRGTVTTVPAESLGFLRT